VFAAGVVFCDRDGEGSNGVGAATPVHRVSHRDTDLQFGLANRLRHIRSGSSTRKAARCRCRNGRELGGSGQAEVAGRQVAGVIELQCYRVSKFAANRHDGRRWMMRKLSAIFILAALTAFAVARPARAADVICYNCPPQRADFASMLKAAKADLGYDIPFDNKNSGQAPPQIIAEKNN
jgi:hypothetical protein